MAEVQLVYISQPFGFDTQRLNSILTVARDRNARDGITGALICRHDMFLQMLEGQEDKVEAVFERIRRDDRHVDVRQLVYDSLKKRLFPEWLMLHDPARSWMWSPAEVTAGAAQKTKPEIVLEIFSRVATEPNEVGAERL